MPEALTPKTPSDKPAADTGTAAAVLQPWSQHLVQFMSEDVGEIRVYEFPNGWGACVMQHANLPAGMWEVVRVEIGRASLGKGLAGRSPVHSAKHPLDLAAVAGELAEIQAQPDLDSQTA